MAQTPWRYPYLRLLHKGTRKLIPTIYTAEPKIINLALIPSDDWFFRAALSHNSLLHLGSFRLFRLHQGSHSRFVPSYRDSFLYLFTVSELTSLLQNGSFDKIHKLAEARLVLLSVSTHSHYYSFALLRLDGVTKALCKCN